MNLLFYLKQLCDEHWDRNATASNVNQFLTKDLPEILNRADRQITDITSPQLNGIPSHGNGHNVSEDKIIDHMDYMAVVECVAETYAHMSNRGSEHRDIIKYLCLYKMTRQDASNLLHIDISTLDKRKIDALCEFADRFQKQKMNSNHEVDWIPDFRVKK